MKYRHATYSVTDSKGNRVKLQGEQLSRIDEEVSILVSKWSIFETPAALSTVFIVDDLTVHVAAATPEYATLLDDVEVSGANLARVWDAWTGAAREEFIQGSLPQKEPSAPPPLSALFRWVEIIPEARMRDSLLSAIADAQEEHHLAMLEGDTRRARLVIWYACWHLGKTLIRALRWLLPLIRWLLTRQ